MPPLQTLAVLVFGLALRLHPALARWSAPTLLTGLVLLGAPVAWRTIRGMLRGEFAADVVAMLAIVTAIVLREPIAGLVIVLMQTGGELLERYAEGRASDAVRALEAAAPRIAHRLRGAGTGEARAEAATAVPDGDADTFDIEDVAAEQVQVGDRILVRPGEMVPCDAEVVAGSSALDTSRITGEPLPERVGPGATVRSGVVNISSPLTLRVTAPARDSLYARIVELVRTAQAQKSPIQRMADRWAIWFTPVTLVACAIAWAISDDPQRVLAVLVVATPCPLLLATPVAVIGGINRAARRQVIVRNGTALELLARVDTAVFDKTGTLTHGRPEVTAVETLDGTATEPLLRAAAAIEMGSGHLLARSVVEETTRRGLVIPAATDIVEHAGRGVTGRIEGRRVSIGNRALVADLHPAAHATLDAHIVPTNGGLRAYVALDGADATAAGVITFGDRMRADLPAFFARLRGLGLTRTVLLSGDHAENVAPIAAHLGITDARGDLLPDEKVAAVRALEASGYRVLMVGDGTNDAPALSAATVGVALAAHGGGISAEAAGVVLLADDVTRVEDAVRIGRRAVAIARQSIVAGLVLSGTAMVVAALGFIPPTAGALLQEGIDVAVILNALRAAAPPPGSA
ncbi:MAG: heavy metal translocating P-type ATPase [Gemmatimonadota bacterium]|nr:heavy metal translocating P-type ATPase [Gemmatimonadota bacterium]